MSSLFKKTFILVYIVILVHLMPTSEGISPCPWSMNQLN